MTSDGPARAELPEAVDVLVVGAGISGVGTACRLARERPGTTFAVLEARGEVGGTWDAFRYPGVRSDSDMHTLAYSWRPWTGERAIVGGEQIRSYVRDTAAECGVLGAVRFGHRVLAADFDSATARWRVEVERTGAGAASEARAPTTTLTCRFLVAATGYFRYDHGHVPDLPGLGDFAGRLVHPQHWPADLDVTGRRVVVIGSGATAVTLVPALAGTASHVTMLQRSPSWLMSLPSRDALADRLRGRLPLRVAAPLVRWRNVARMAGLYSFSRRAPRLLARLLRAGVARQLPGVDLDPDFEPTYRPWDQRLCFVPDGDLFAALRSGRADVVTDRIDSFTTSGVRLASGAELAADVVVTATGLELQIAGGMGVRVDGVDVDLAATVAYKGLMLSGVPNFMVVIGYVNASWTLRVDLVTRYLVRLLDRLDARGDTTVTPLPPPTAERTPLLDLSSGYVRRARHLVPSQGARRPWRLPSNHVATLLALRLGRVADRGVAFSRAPG